MQKIKGQIWPFSPKFSFENLEPWPHGGKRAKEVDSYSPAVSIQGEG